MDTLKYVWVEHLKMKMVERVMGSCVLFCNNI